MAATTDCLQDLGGTEHPRDQKRPGRAGNPKKSWIQAGRHCEIEPTGGNSINSCGGRDRSSTQMNARTDGTDPANKIDPARMIGPGNLEMAKTASVKISDLLEERTLAVLSLKIRRFGSKDDEKGRGTQGSEKGRFNGLPARLLRCIRRPARHA